MARDESQAATDHETVGAMADRLKLKGKARDDYIHRHMTRLGHRAVTQYVDRDDDDDDDESGFFGRRRRRSPRDDDDDDF